MIDTTLLLLLILALVADAAIVWYRRRAKRRAPVITLRAPLRFSPDIGWLLLIVVLFLGTRLIALDQWPIYFFTDEAVNGVRAAELLSNGLRDTHAVLLPTYFQNGLVTSLSTSVYAQLIPTALFGLSVWVVRATAVLIALSGALAVGLILRDGFKVRYWWLGALILSITPAWFLQSRTAFEHPVWVACYAWFIYFYLRYRLDQPRHLLAAIVCGALAFYAYNGGQLGVVLTGVLLLISDARYHWRTLRARPKLLLATSLVIFIAIAPYVRFYAENSGEINRHLTLLDSYWTQALSPGDKLSRLIQEYWNGLRPDYWFAPDSPRDLIRHQMKGYAQLPVYLLPFFIGGMLWLVKRWRSSPTRSVLIMLLIAPLGGVLTTANVLRDLIFILPATLLSALGLIALLDFIGRRMSQRVVALGAGAIFTIIHLAMLNDAITHGPTWYTDYGLNGLQYGGPQVFAEAQRLIAADAQRQVWIAPTWLNGPAVLKAFFAPTEPRIRLFDLNAILHDRYDIEALTLVLDRADYQRVNDSGLFSTRSIDQVLPYPDGTPGFSFVRLAYSPQATALLAADAAARTQLLSETIEWQGQPLSVAHSRLDIGSIDLLFDNDLATLIRTHEANPAIIDVTFPQPRALSGVRVSANAISLTLTADITTSPGDLPQHFTQTYTTLPANSTVELNFGATLTVTRLRLEMLDLDAPPYAFIHVREVQFEEAR